MKAISGLALAFMLTALGCGTETGVQVSGQTEGDVVEIQKSDDSAAPRCGPRNCIAMCVTCFYDLCLKNGGSIKECSKEMESCKEDCFRGLDESPRFVKSRLLSTP